MTSAVNIYEARPWVQHYGDMPAELPGLEHQSLPELIHDSAEHFADHKAFTTVTANGMNGTLTYRQVQEKSDDFAVYLREGLGLQPGTRVAVQMPNCLSYPVVAFAILKAGLVLVNVNPLYTAEEMKHQLADSGAEALIIVDLFADKLADVFPATPVRYVIVTRIPRFFPWYVAPVIQFVLRYWHKAVPECRVPHLGLEKALQEGARLRRKHDVRVTDYWKDLGPDDLAALQYTGGTTGAAKGAMLTQGNLLTNIGQTDAKGRSSIETGGECVLTALPLYHIFAFTVNLMAFFKAGAHNILVPSPRPIRNLKRAIENYPISWMTGVNTLYHALLNEEWFWRHPPKNLKGAIAGGAALHPSVARRWEDITGTRLMEGYGLTESAPTVTFSPMEGEVRPGSIGIPLPGIDIRIVDEQGRAVPQGESGELLVRGAQVMSGYWHRAEETAETLRDGWLHTGDVARMDEDGFLYIVDRMKDLVIVSGFNVYPNEVEQCITRIDAVQDAAVIGVPDEQTGEALKACVVKRAELTREAIIEHCRQYLTGYKVPKQIEFREELPTTAVGKVLRKELRAENNAQQGGETS